ncbi:MAG: HDOD domain-containing protein [Deltaproteobacteria bacterium]|jgi:putative nucleotidyltransferase with HDIG domain|nr:HDOD domain-containing protein [Deltaproteobacteria bacterium]MBW2478784.1 HDOD domain-containing protein [Deltaproteobacteria bacterium]
MRILVVDDEMVSRTKLKLIMENFGHCEVAENGKAALAMFHKAHQQGKPFGLIMLDIDMPEMDGMQVLSEMIRAQIELKIPGGRRSKILMVTSYTDKDRVLICIQSGCDDYIAKPFDVDTIGKKLSKLGIHARKSQPKQSAAQSPDDNGSSHFIDGIVSAFEGKKINLPTLPRIQPKFRELLMTGAVSQRIADLLKKDVAISAELIRMSNSVYYRGFIPNKSLEQAISRIGAAATEQVVAELTGRQFFTMKNKKFRTLIEKVWKHSIACAYASEITANLLNLELAADPFAMGLLHDIGKLALLEIMADMERRGQCNGGIPRAKLVETITAHHGVVGAKLLEKWKYADSYIACASDHEDDGADEDQETSAPLPREILIVRFANMAAKSMGYSLEENEYTDLPIENIELAYDLKLNLIDIGKLKEQLTEEMKAVMELF